MANLYIELDATHTDYQRFVDALHTKVNSNFTARPSLAGAKALIQVKDRYLAGTLSERNSLSPFVLDSGDEDWSRSLVAGIEWESGA